MPDALTGFQQPPGNMVQEVKNIVEAYKMGPLRALAQDPPQNSVDARQPGAEDPVVVEYGVHQRTLASGESMCLLTVTDRNTTGLQGPALTFQDLQRRADDTGYLQLQPHENWAAWEAMGYTKAGEDYLGSRGQGKSAFLYHSRHSTGLIGPGGRSLDRMIILYDTLLVDGTYRLGVRLAQPADLVKQPPYEGTQAKDIVCGEFAEWPGYPIPLLLEPLQSVGTRIIVPFLSDEAVEAFASGEMGRWLERCWWRAIQVGDLQLEVLAEGGERLPIAVPSWWDGEPWRAEARPPNLHVKENIRLEPNSQFKIKRIVLLHDAALAHDEIEDYPSQCAGVQLLRGHQWIETLGSSEKYGDFIPTDRRPGFRGFIEFDQRLERELREVESPQHDTFYRQRTIVKQIDAHVRDAVREFAESQGWITTEPEHVRDDHRAQEILERIADIFVAEGGTPGSHRTPTIVWTCDLDVTFPDPDTARVNWDESLTNLLITCRHEPGDDRKDVILSLHLVRPDGQRVQVDSKNRRTTGGQASAEMRDLKVVRVARRAGEIECPEPGKYKLRAECEVGGQVVATAVRTFYLRVNPPERPPRPFSADIAVRNASADRIRLNHGDRVDIALTVTNRTRTDARLFADVSFGPLLLADGEALEVPGRPTGDTPSSRMLTFSGVHVCTREPAAPAPARSVVLPPGRHFVRADVRNDGGDIVASAATAVWVETDPDEGAAAVPFDVRFREDPNIPYPVWELEPPHGNGLLWVLWCARHHPSYQAALRADTTRVDGQTLVGTRLYFAETFCGALVEWALALYREQGNQGGFKLLTGQSNNGHPLWERYEAKIEDLITSYQDPLTCLALQREVVSLMLYIARAEID